MDRMSVDRMREAAAGAEITRAIHQHPVQAHRRSITVEGHHRILVHCRAVECSLVWKRAQIGGHGSYGMRPST
jgi:hypothetical protein